MSRAPRYRLGIDIGGSFTDFVLVDEVSGRMYVNKIPTTPQDPAYAAIKGLKELLDKADVSGGEISLAIHATTLITNALVERKGAKTALVTTEGFRDVLEMGTEIRYDIYDLFLERPEPLVPRQHRYEIPERMDKDGQVLIPLDHARLRLQASEIRREGIRAIAIVFLHSFRNPEHERQAQEILQSELEGISVSLSSDVAPEIREYERMSTTVGNAYVQPIASKYIERLEAELAEVGYKRRMFLMLSSGGITTPATAAKFPIRLAESGPAAGVLAVKHLCKPLGIDHVISFDMGGTTAKISVLENGEPAKANIFEIGRVKRFKKGSGLPIKVPVIELIEIGAGGGSISHVDELGLLKVGPRSAGADPGPACYGRGGEEPTVTDADLVLGYLNPLYFLGGRLILDSSAAWRSIETGLATRLGISAADAAKGIHQVVNQNMLSALRVHIAERGVDPRRFFLVAFGGAGPTHAYELARALHMKGVLIPPNAGVASAMGLVTTAVSFEFARSFVVRLDRVEWNQLRAVYDEMAEGGRALLTEAGIDPDAPGVRFVRSMDLRHVGQGHELTVELPGGVFAKGSVSELIQFFYSQYGDKYGHAHTGLPVELITCRSSISGPPPSVLIRSVEELGNTDHKLALKGKRKVYLIEAGSYVDTPIYDRYLLSPGTEFLGPAVIEEQGCTVVAGVNSQVRIDENRNLFLVFVA